MLHMQLEQVLPEEIERRSFELIGQELHSMGIVLAPDQEPIIKRAIHTTADFDYAHNLVFSGQAVQKAAGALRQGAVIVTDTHMGWSGVNKRKLSALGGEAFCFMADEDVAREAEEKGTTRAVASMEKAARLFGNCPAGRPDAGNPVNGPDSRPDTGNPVSGPDSRPDAGNPAGGPAARPDAAPRPCIFAIGNAPTALIRLYELLKEGRISPALIIGAPVGFVNVVQSKEMILTLEDTPYIVARGRKGGSNVAAAICNALIYQVAYGFC